MTALATIWRPKTFEEYQGQEHVINSIVHSLTSGRIHHAYLFSGTRGVGKTTVARLFAKSISCNKGISAHPCEQCEQCTAINNNSFIDLIEVDAASKTKVEDTRELLEHSQFMPHSGRFKIFIIDEVHMLSNHSFNALLKTLEEPPEHVKFLLATTDPQKLPITVISRCLHFQLLPLPAQMIANHLEKILTAEKISYELAAINQIAEHADGSVRDALSCADQLIALGGGKVDISAVTTLLGLTEPKLISELMQYILTKDRAAALALIENMYSSGVNLKTVASKLMVEIYHKMSAAFPKQDSADELETLHYYYQIAVIGMRDFDYNPNSLIALSMTIMRMLDFQKVGTQTSPKAAETKQSATIVLNSNANDSILANLQVTGMTKAIVQSLEIQEHTAAKLHLVLASDKKALLTPIHSQKIKDALKKSGYNGEIVLNCGESNHRSSNKISEAFNGSVLSSSERD